MERIRIRAQEPSLFVADSTNQRNDTAKQLITDFQNGEFAGEFAGLRRTVERKWDDHIEEGVIWSIVRVYIEAPVGIRHAVGTLSQRYSWRYAGARIISTAISGG